MALGCGAAGTGWARIGELINEGRAWCSPFRSVWWCGVEIRDIHTDRCVYKHTQTCA